MIPLEAVKLISNAYQLCQEMYLKWFNKLNIIRSLKLIAVTWLTSQSKEGEGKNYQCPPTLKFFAVPSIIHSFIQKIRQILEFKIMKGINKILIHKIIWNAIIIFQI